MNIHVCGINYKTAPLSEREKLSFNKEEQIQVMKQLLSCDDIDECVMLCTCNRTEVYVCSASKQFEKNFNSSFIEMMLCNAKNIDYHYFKKYFYLYSGSKAVNHLFKVAAGLDSMVVGEDQILKQVKDAHLMAMDAGTSASVLNTLFRQAVTVAKEVKTRTELSRKSVSIASIAVKLLIKHLGANIKDKTVLIIGTGDTGSVLLKNLLCTEVGKICLSGRTHGKIPSCILSDPRIDVEDYSQRYYMIDKADAVVSCTSSPHYTITADMIDSSLTVLKTRIFIDLAVPRDIDEEIKNRQDVVYYNIDDLKHCAEDNRMERVSEAIKAESIIGEYAQSFEKWCLFRDALPMVNEIKNNAYAFAVRKIEEMIRDNENIDPNKKPEILKCFQKAFNSITDRFLYDVKDAGTKEEIDAYYRCLHKVSENLEKKACTKELNKKRTKHKKNQT